MMMIRDNFSRKSWIYLLVKKEGAYKTFKFFLASTPTDGRVEMVRSDRGSEFRGRFADIRVDNKITREFTAVNSPRQNGSIEHAFSIVDNTQLAVRIKAEKSFREPKAPAPKSAWNETSSSAVDCLKRTATRSNLGYVSPEERYYGTSKASALRPFLQPGYFLRKRL